MVMWPIRAWQLHLLLGQVDSEGVDVSPLFLLTFFFSAHCSFLLSVSGGFSSQSEPEFLVQNDLWFPVRHPSDASQPLMLSQYGVDA